MRTKADRWRHAIGFELIGLILVVFGLNLILGADIGHLGVMGVLFSVIATGWNYVYNILFDRAMLAMRGSVLKTLPIRILHAVLFEAGLLVVTIPFIMWWLSMTLWQAVVMDLGMVVFYLFYAFVYNWVYDQIFPIPSHSPQA
ncbi:MULTISPECIES: PACE efflux transporter [Salinivibrio]|uniref:PACE efflux transporter n=1 Tax=Salinivibrio TaxID=51366 RepID=UPI0009897870|nr:MULTISPECIES: PACE efflux transporter [Salinivibrio]OOF10671.1 transporter [Salinivibrio sp. PR5]OOF18965.1 transporter [Salinivibrio sp. PR932]OOF29896.1 transporter [Salinivibrio proteolyticus]